MRILFITPSYVYPPVKGYQVMLCRHIEELAGRHTIDLLAFGDPESSDADPIKKLCNLVEIIPLPKLKMALNLLFGLFSYEPLQVSVYRSKEMTAAVESRLRSTCYDAIVCQLIRSVQFLPNWYQGGTLLNMVDPLILNYSRSLAWRPFYLRIALKHEISRLHRYEKKYSRRFDCVSLISKADVEDYQLLLNEANFLQIPYGIDTDFFYYDEMVERIPGMIVITGNMGYAPNVDGVIFFCREVLPLILAEEPSANLWLVGVRPSAKINKLKSSQHITVTGYVKDVRYYLHRAMVSVCPIRLKVGTQTKVLEALATGTPMVSTTAGNHGVGGKTGIDLYVADTPSEIARRVVSLLRGRNHNNLSANGRKFVEHHFQWARSAKILESILSSFVVKTRVKS